MGEIHFGLKLWARNYEHIGEAADLIRSGVFDYLEVMPEPGYDIGRYPPDIQYIIHGNKFMNAADPAMDSENRSLMRLGIRWADTLKADTIILHPGQGRLEDSRRFVNDEEWRQDSRIIVENMPHVIGNLRNIPGNSPEEIKQYGRPICLDVGHMISSAVSNHADYKEFFDNFLALKPRMGHLMDGFSRDENDQHLGIGDGDYDFHYLVNKMIEANVRYFTLETPWDTMNNTAAQLEKLKRLL